MRPSRAMCGAGGIRRTAGPVFGANGARKHRARRAGAHSSQSDPEMKLLLLDRFGKDYQRAGMIHWAYDEVCKTFETSGQPVRALAAGEKLLAHDPRDVEIAQKSLKIAEDQKDAALIEKWSAIAARAAGSAEAGNAGALHDHVEYLAYSGLARIADPGRKRAAIEEFLKSHKGSAWSDRCGGPLPAKLAEVRRPSEQRWRRPREFFNRTTATHCLWRSSPTATCKARRNRTRCWHMPGRS